DNDVSLIEVNIFESEDSTTPMKTVKLENIPLTIEQDVAVYDAEEANDYAIIYGHTDANGIIAEIGETEHRYCTLTIYDSAEKYPVDGSAQTEEDKKGNGTNVYYMNSEVSSLIQGKYKITDLYHMKNGTFDLATDRAAVSGTIITALDALKVTKSKFSINPANNPKYIVSSGSVLENGKDLNHVDYQLTAGNRYIEVEITPGLDGHAIVPSTVGIYLLECDKDGIPINPDEKIWLIKTGADYHKTQEEAEAYEAAQGQSYGPGYGIYSVSGSTYKFKTSKTISKNSYSVSADNFYLVMLEGNDIQGVESGKIISDGKFGFKLVSNEEKIELKAEGAPEYLSQNATAWTQTGHDKFTVTLTWTTSAEGPFSVYRQNGSEAIFVDTKDAPDNQSSGSWSATEEFDYTKLSGLTFPDSLEYFLKNKNDEKVSTTAQIKLKYDSTNPKVSNVQISNSYEKKVQIDENNYKYTYYVRNVSGNTCEITGVVTDNTGLDEVNAVQLQIPGLP
ncbi:MAG: hypothetical protein IKN54_02410, partial [Lachnospiraceae bacterium]|nr:hypothetical protein [Lachnospiraceae bacterium]